ncbi:PH domain-containing protein [Nocardia uniformis]|uniref:PH domain-containing protein n=1 Tax=Nocardia uniformis TaxID=53432 RepID=A0A849BTC5_9NOCA|nr:PH domain-containing protein [Nocardia uniformis]NNH69843.1 PH domain-containing protein [Nocardia uniformis]
MSERPTNTAETPDPIGSTTDADRPATPPGNIETPWQRLDRRMLLVHPVTEVVRYIPVLIASVIGSAQSENPLWALLALTAIVGIAVTRWFTTTYRIGPDNVELRTGLVQRKKLAVPRSRIRSVDIQADLLHRVLGLAILEIGTGQQANRGEEFKLDALDARLVPGLRIELLAHTAGAAAAQQTPRLTKDSDATVSTAGSSDEPDATANLEPVDTAPEGVEIAHWQPKWVRYSPLSLTGFALIAPIVGLAFQYGFAQVVFDSTTFDDFGARGVWFLGFLIVALAIALIAIVSLAACARYLATYFGLKVLDNGKTLHLRHGLFTTRQITLDLARLRGATVNEPLLLRMAGGAELEAIMTGTDPRQKILPQAPRAAVDRTLTHLLGESTPSTVALTPHGPAARYRRYTRALGPVLTAAAIMAVFALAVEPLPVWSWSLLALVLLIATAVAWDRYRGLGHLVIPAADGNPTWLIARSGSLDRDRDCLEAPGIIGWTVGQSWFQRRVGVATLTAATAAGKKRYTLIDIPLDAAWPLIDAVTPGLLGRRNRG